MGDVKKNLGELRDINNLQKDVDALREQNDLVSQLTSTVGRINTDVGRLANGIKTIEGELRENMKGALLTEKLARNQMLSSLVQIINSYLEVEFTKIYDLLKISNSKPTGFLEYYDKILKSNKKE